MVEDVPQVQVSVVVHYFFLPHGRVQPYLSGGGFRASTTTGGASGNQAAGYVEYTIPEAYIGFVLGGGVRIPVATGLSIRPEFRDSYTEGFRTARTAVALGYQW